MEYKKLNNGLEMPILGMGTYQVRDPEECKNQVKLALKHSYRLIDTARAIPMKPISVKPSRKVV